MNVEGQLGEKSSHAHCENMENTPLHCIAGKCNVDSIRKTAVNPCAATDTATTTSRSHVRLRKNA